MTPGEIDAIVKQRMAAGLDLYNLDDDALARCNPDLILSQDLCRVCAVASGDVDAAVARLNCDATVLQIDPQNLHQVIESINTIAVAAGVADRGIALTESLHSRLKAVAMAVVGKKRPKVFVLEWTDPPFGAGHWVPDIITAAGGEPVLCRPGDRLGLATPEAQLSGSGNWAIVGANRAGGGSAGGPQRRTVLNFKLDIRDSGDLLGRMGMANVVRRGKGRMEGQVAWIGAPFSPDYRSMTGQINLNVESGQFLKADPGLAKLLGVLSLQSLPRRLTLDFRDVFSEGFAFDFVRGDVRIEQGVATTNNLQMKGVNAAVLMEGSANIDQETQDLRVVVVPEINAMTASLVATAINPVIGLGSFLAQVFLRGPLIEAATQEFRVDGAWSDPRVVRVPRRGREGVGSTGHSTPAPQVASPEPTHTGDPS